MHIINKVGILALSLFLLPLSHADDTGQTIQIYTHFKMIETGMPQLFNPSWVLILRDPDTNQVLPYEYDIKHKDNFFMALNFGHRYQITSSTLSFGDFAVIHNFCGLEDGVISGRSLFIKLSGVLSPEPNATKCHVKSYPNLSFTLANGNGE